MKNDSKRLSAEQIMEIMPDGLIDPKTAESKRKLFDAIMEGKETPQEMRRRVNTTEYSDEVLVEMIKDRGGDPNNEETVQDFIDLLDFHGV